MISDLNSEITIDSSNNDIKFNGDFFQNSKNIDFIKTTISNSKDITNDFLYYSDKIECIPSIIHFSGFNINTTQKQFIRIVNKGPKKIRINVVPPETSNFSIEHKKRGYIIPQMSEEVLISFTPTQWKYYYDTIKIIGPDINVVVPIHGYPVLTDIEFPKRINFGDVPLTYTKTKTIPIKCNVPIDFEFKIDITEPNPFYNIYPLKGIIPALGSLDIVIEYKPCSHQSSHLTFQINISQFNFKPYTVKVFGSCHPNILLQKTNDLIKQVYGKKKKRYGDDVDDEDENINLDNNEYTIDINDKYNHSDNIENVEEDENKNNLIKRKSSLNNENNEIMSNLSFDVNNEETEKVEIIDYNENPPTNTPLKSERSQKNMDQQKDEISDDDQYEADMFIANFKKRKEYEKYKEMHRFVCVGEDISEDVNNEDSSTNKIVIPDILKIKPEMNYETIKQSQNILIGHDIKNYYFFENNNYKKDWESKERIVKKFLRLHYKNIYQIRARRLLNHFREWRESNSNNNSKNKKLEKHRKKMLKQKSSITDSLTEPINEQKKEYIDKLNKHDENIKLFLPQSIIFDETHPFRKPYTIKPIEINHISIWNPIPFQEPLEYQLLNYQPQPDISISEYLFTNVNQDIVDKTEEIKIIKRTKKYYIPELPSKLIKSSFIPLEIFNPNQYTRNNVCYWNVKIDKNIEYEMFKPTLDSLEDIAMDANIQLLNNINTYASRNMVQNEDAQISFYFDSKLCTDKFQNETHKTLVSKIWKDIREETKAREEKEERKRRNRIKNLNRYKKLQVSQTEFSNEDEDSSKQLHEKKNENKYIEDISNLIDFDYCDEFLSFLYE
ncbi:hypothetical protein BCR36DRAFT_408845 [Piromyces finnis]|uniref:MSP domain-containing protein n=1 Tax=Piromyces finnis TaxID=1754191 RepID=A0A1Y1VLK2_9FUNG|nr:hypothetical protein BCR36DRAFT_408845 [Piromyces finnis]|eukprot:ORX59350.1 hypothetical protein BCR36DRAFT_408845 [Piromyces finnis]